MWDERYSAEEYAYGTEPNTFLTANFAHLPKGRVLSLAEGEGRNAVFLAQQGYGVTGVDGTGGGKSEEVMQTAASLRAELPGLDFVHLVELERDVVEGVFHTGLGAVVQAIGVKPAAATP